MTREGWYAPRHSARTRYARVRWHYWRPNAEASDESMYAVCRQHMYLSATNARSYLRRSPNGAVCSECARWTDRHGTQGTEPAR